MLTRGRVVLAVFLAVLWFNSAVYVRAQSIAAIPMVAVAMPPKQERGIAWSHLFESSLMFLSVEHVFRYATEQGPAMLLIRPSGLGILIPWRTFTGGQMVIPS